MPRLSVVVLSVLLGACLALPAAAQWKWRGKDGQIQYSDLPPPAGTPERDILQRPQAQRRLAAAAEAASAASAASASASGLPAVAKVEPELEAKRRKAQQEAADKEKAEQARVAAGKAENCTRAKSYLRTLDDGMRVGRIDAKGEREILDDKARAEETQRTRDVIARDCPK
jgi:hypothetical protein